MSSYTVRSGDTLSGIAQSQLGDATRYLELATINGISAPYTIYPGQVLQLPGTVAAPAATAVATVPATTPASSTAAAGALTATPASSSPAISGLASWWSANKSIVVMVALGVGLIGAAIYLDARKKRRRSSRSSRPAITKSHKRRSKRS